MSFLTEATTRRLATLSTQAIRSTTVTTTAPRAAFSSSVTLQKTVADTTKDTLKTVDRTMSDKLVDAIDIGCTSPTHFSSPVPN